MIGTVEAIPAWLAVPAVIFMLAAGIFIVIGTFGLLRLPNFYQRIHGPPIAINVGTLCLVIGSVLYFSGLESRPVIHELIIPIFILLTAPVTSMLIMRAAVYRDLRAGKVDKKAQEGDAYHFPREE